MLANSNFKMASSLAALVAVTLSCTLGAAPTPTAEPTALPPTATTIPPTATQRPPTRTATPKDTATPAPEELLPLSADAYVHPSAVFTIDLPEGWEAVDYDNSMFAAAPARSDLFMDAGFTNVGVEFDDTMLVTYMTAVSTNWWGGLKDYNPNAPELLSDGFWVVVAYALGENDTPMAIVSYYWRVGEIIFTTDFGCPFEEYEAYLPAFGALANSLKVDARVAAGAPLYQTRQVFSGPKALFQMSVPVAWTHTQSEDGITSVDTFASPDGNSAILSIGYDDGTPISKSVAGQFALNLLHDVFKIQDVKVTDDQVQPDGSERLIWTSPGLDGITFFETRGTTFLMLSWIVNAGYYDLYFPLWEELLNTYTIAQ